MAVQHSAGFRRIVKSGSARAIDNGFGGKRLRMSRTAATNAHAQTSTTTLVAHAKPTSEYSRCSNTGPNTRDKLVPPSTPNTSNGGEESEPAAEDDESSGGAAFGIGYGWFIVAV
ncbi:hypothetical protein ColTof4_13989 [Colletotrichum tofieldiae]|nr:hypothetical protein ColTof4_13989 [Colletotrichum tofieldiae]